MLNSLHNKYEILIWLKRQNLVWAIKFNDDGISLECFIVPFVSCCSLDCHLCGWWVSIKWLIVLYLHIEHIWQCGQSMRRIEVGQIECKTIQLLSSMHIWYFRQDLSALSHSRKYSTTEQCHSDWLWNDTFQCSNLFAIDLLRPVATYWIQSYLLKQ